MTSPNPSNATVQTTTADASNMSDVSLTRSLTQVRDQAIPPEQVVDPASPPEPDYDAQFKDWAEVHLGQYGY